MSGAEAFFVLGVAANIVQFISFTGEFCSLLREYSNGPGVPKKVALQADRLDHLLRILDSLCKTSHQESLERQIVAGCQAQAGELYCLLESLRGSNNGQDRWWKNAKKALKSLSRAEKIRELQTTLDSLVNTLGLQLQVNTRDQNQNVEANTISILQGQDDQSRTLDEIRQLSQLTLGAGRQTAVVDQPIWLVPIGRNPEFVGRGHIIEDLQERLGFGSDIVRRVVLCGLGGVGKSQIALEYAYRERDVSSDVSVFWVHSTNTARFVESFKRIASELNIPGRESPEIDVLQLVRDHLESKYRCNWLMIVDNVDDRITFFEDQSYKGKSLCEYIPQTPRGAIMYTTRNREIGVDLDSDRDPIEVPSMNVEDGRSLLGPKIRAQSTQDEQIELLEELVYLPLAITQAVAFMIKRRKTVRQYLESYRQSDSTRIRLLGQRFLHHGREQRPLESVATTFWISFNFIKSDTPRAARLLSIMSILDRQGIPDSLVLEDDEDSFDLDEAVGILDSFSLITRNPTGDASNMHRLVQVATRAWLLEYEGSAESTATDALKLLASRFPNGTYENWSICAMYLPHADAILRYEFAERTKEHEAARGQLLLDTAAYLRRQGRFSPAKLRSAESMAIRESLYGIEHPDTLAAIAEYAMTIHKRGNYEEAVRLQRLVLAGREKVLGLDDRATLETMNALGYDLRSLGRYTEAEEIHRREMTLKQKLLDGNPDDVGLQADLLVAVNNAARLLSHQGKHAEAERMHRDSLEKTIRLMGPDHPDCFITMGELASDLRDQDKLEESQITYKRLLESRIRVLGPLHPDTLLTKSNIATLRARQGHQDEAERLYKQVHQEELEVLGAKHPSTLNSLHNLACAFADQGRDEEAAESFQKALDLQTEVLGRKHPDLLNTRMNLAISLRAIGRTKEAQKMLRETVDLAQSKSEDCDAGQLRSLSRLAAILSDQGNYAEAEKLYRQELHLTIKVTGTDSPETQKCQRQLANVLSQQDQYEEAINFSETALSSMTKTLGMEHEMTLSVLWNLAMSYRNSHRLEEAEPRFETLVDTKAKILGRDDPEVLESLVQLAWVQQQLKNYVESEKNYRWLLASQTKNAGPEDPFTLMLTHNLASVLNYQDKVEEAETLFRRAYTMRSKILGPDNPLSRHSLQCLADLLDESGKQEEAAELLRESGDSPDDAAEHQRKVDNELRKQLLPDPMRKKA